MPGPFRTPRDARRLAALVAAATWACGAGADARGPGHLRLGADVDAETLDPRLMRNTTAYRVVNLVYDGLVELDADLGVRPGLAERWDRPSPTEWIFHLRPGVVFHDGSPLSADDVVHTFSTILDPAFGARFRSLYAPIAAVEALDSLTVRVELSEPYAPLLSYMDVGIVPRAYERAQGDLATRPVGTGPMRFVSWSRGSEIRLEAFDGYWAGRPRVDRFDFVVVPDNTARAQAFEAGDLDLVQSPLSPEDARRLLDDDRFVAGVRDGLALTYLNFNSRAPPLDDPAFRRALSRLVDRETIVSTIYRGVDEPATSALLPVFSAYADSIRQPDFDPEGAARELEALGWRDTDGDGVLDRNGRPLTLELATHAEDPNRVQAAEFVQAVFRERGVDLRLSVQEWPAFFAAVQGGRHQIALLGWTNLVDPDRLLHAQLRTGGDLNYGGYSNPEVDRLLDRGRVSLDPAERDRAYRAAAGILAREVPWLAVSYQSYQVFHAPDVTLEVDPRGMMRSAIGIPHRPPPARPPA